MSLIETRRVPMHYIGAGIVLIILFVTASLSYIISQINNQGSADQLSIGLFLAILVAIAVMLFVRFSTRKSNRRSVATSLR